MRFAKVTLALVLVTAAARAGALDLAKKGEALRLSGKYAEARTLLEKASAKDLAARLELGLLYKETGEPDRAKAIWNQFFDDYESGAIDKKNARALLYVALAAQHLGSIQDANDTFRDAVDADPKGKDGARANVEWAALFLEKYDAGHAEVSLDEALKILPDDADAHALMARVKLEQGYDVASAEVALGKALSANPRHTGALAIRAELLIDNEEYSAAQKICDQILRINPEDERGHTLKAAAMLLTDDKAGFAAERDRVLKTNPYASRFFHGVAEFMVKQHRYLEADELEAAALKADPKDSVARAALGSNLLRLGRDADGLAALQAAWKGDHYNVRTYNLLNLFEDVIPKSYALVERKPFRFRFSIKEQAVLEHYLAPFVEGEYAELVKRYHFTPSGPLTVELFTDPQHYAVRTVGLPGLEALAVTFGQVITGMSPTGKFHWGMAMWHEVGHIFSIQLSNSRVPRWFTEGLSEWETANHNTSWTRYTHAELYRALATGKVHSVGDLNAAFNRARDIQHMVVAYHEAAEAVSFLIRRFGIEKARQALLLFAQGKQTPEVITTVTGLPLASFDEAFLADLHQRLSVYDGQFFVRSSDYSDVEALSAQMKKDPNDLTVKGLYALALIDAHKGEEAKTVVDQGLKQQGERRYLLLAAARLAYRLKDHALALELYDDLIAQKGDGFDARFGRAQSLSALGKPAEADFERAKKLDPDRVEPYLALAKIYDQKHDDRVLAELEKAATIDIMDGSITKHLLEKYVEKKDWSDAMRAGERALFVNLFDGEVHMNLARAYGAVKRNADAKSELKMAALCELDEAQKKMLADLKAQIH